MLAKRRRSGKIPKRLAMPIAFPPTEPRFGGWLDACYLTMMFLPKFLFAALLLLPFGLRAEMDSPVAIEQASAVHSDARAWLARHAQAPSAYISRQFKEADVVLLGEDHRVRENLLFVQSIVPDLYAAGVHVIGMEFGAAEDQDDLDALVMGAVYDEPAARRIMFGYDTGWPYREYMDIYRAVWAFNRTLPPGAPRMRVLNLSYRYDWSAAGPVTTPARAARIFHRGPVDRFRAERIASEVLARGEKMLALVGTIHAVTRFEWPVYDYVAPGFVRADDGHLGNLLVRRFPGRVRTILLHQPFPDRLDGAARLVQPAGGMIEQLAQAPVGFDLRGTPMGALSDSSLLAGAEPSVPLSRIADGYIVLVPFSRLTGCTVDRAFISPANWAEARARLPRELREVPDTIDAYWQSAENYADLSTAYADVR